MAPSWWNCAGLADASVVPQTLASALGVNEKAGKSHLQRVVAHLSNKRVLIVLDNAEHLVKTAPGSPTKCFAVPENDGARDQPRAACIAGERTYRVPSLTIA